MPLSKEKIEQIGKDAYLYAPLDKQGIDDYILGATVEAERAEVLVKALQEIKRKANWISGDEREIASKALSEYQSYTSATKS